MSAWDARSGRVVWSFYAGGGVESHPAAHGGLVYVSTETPSSALFALNATTGTEARP